MKSLATELVYVDTVHMLLPHELCHQLIHWNQNAGALPYAVEGLTPQPEKGFSLFAVNLVSMQAALCHWAFGSMEYL